MLGASYQLEKELKIKLVQSQLDTSNTWLTIGELNITLNKEQLEELTEKLNAVTANKYILSVATRNTSDLNEEELEDYRYELRDELNEVSDTINSRLCNTYNEPQAI